MIRNRTIFVFSLGFLTCSSLWAGCQKGSFSYTRSTSVGVAWGESSFGQEVVVNIPLRVNGKAACYKQKGKIAVETKRVKDREFVEYEIRPMAVEFENVPDAGVYQYLNVDDLGASDSQLSIVSFICSGETPIGSNAFSDSLRKLMTKTTKTVSTSMSTFIATGEAANILARQEVIKNRPIYRRFKELLAERTTARDYSGPNSSISVPAVIAGTSLAHLGSTERALYADYNSKTGADINGCSKLFREAMKEFLLDNVIRESPFPNVELRRTRVSKTVKLKWTL
jgi:hypothetical protein